MWPDVQLAKKIPEKRLKRRMTGAMFGWAAVPASCTSSRVSRPITWVMDTYGVLKSCENVSTPLSLGEPVGYSSQSWRGGRLGRRWGNGGWPYLSWPQIFWAHLKIVSVCCGCLAMVAIYFFCSYNWLYQKLRALSYFFEIPEICFSWMTFLSISSSSSSLWKVVECLQSALCWKFCCLGSSF